jgi:DNA polymerase III alpha subunit
VLNDLKVLPPDVNASGYRFAPVADAHTAQGKPPRTIRYGLGAVKGTGQGAVEEIVRARQAGPYTSLFDFCRRIDRHSVNRRSIEALIRAGAFDSIQSNRAALLASLATALEAADQAERSANQVSLFGDDSDAVVAVELAKVPAWDLRSRLSEEKLALGYFFSGHLFDAWRDEALMGNAELVAANHNVEVARQEFEKQAAGHYPVVSAIASWNQSKSAYTSAINQNANTSSAGVQVSIPIFSSGEVAGRANQARANYEKALAERDAVRDRVITELRKQFDAVKSTMARVSALNRAVESSTELTKAMRKSVLGGQRINLDVLLADKALATARRDLAQSKYNYMISLLKLKQLAGNLVPEDLEKIALHFEKPKREKR